MTSPDPNLSPTTKTGTIKTESSPSRRRAASVAHSSPSPSKSSIRPRITSGIIDPSSNHLNNHHHSSPTSQNTTTDQLQQALNSNHSPKPAPTPFTAIDESLKSFKLLQALRQGDPQTILSLVSSSSSTPDLASISPERNHPNRFTPLHLAVRCAKYHIVQLILSNCPPTYVTSQDPSGQTPLHIACELGRADVVNLLLSQPQVDDSIRDRESRTCLEVCKNAQVARLIQNSRAQLSASFLALLSAYIASPLSVVVSQAVIDASLISGDPSDLVPSSMAINNHESAADQLYHLMQRPGSRSIDFNLKEEHSGTTILHEAARRKDIHLIELAINRGADVLARDRKNKMPIDMTTDEKVKALLRKAAASLEGQALTAPLTAKGWTLDANGPILANPNKTLTGSGSATSLAYPTLKGYLSKWTNMARGYSTRWLVLENGYMSYYRDQKDEGKTLRGSIAMSVAVIAGPDITKDKLRFEVSSKLGSSYPRFYLKGAHPLEVMRWVDALKQSVKFASGASQTVTSPTPNSTIRKQSVQLVEPPEKKGFVNRHLKPSRAPSSASSSRRASRRSIDANSRQPTMQMEDLESPDGSMFAPSVTDDESYGKENGLAPYENEMELIGQGLKTHIEMTKQLIDSLTISGLQSPLSNPLKSLPHAGESSTPAVAVVQRQVEVKAALKHSMDDLSGMIEDYLNKSAERERFHIRRYEEELSAKKLWEENMQALIATQAEMEQELQTVVRDSSRRKKQLKSLKAGMTSAATGTMSKVGSSGLSELDQSQNIIQLGSGEAEKSLPTDEGINSNPSQPAPTTSRFENLGEASSEDDDDDDDEFFEAIETGAIAVEPMSLSKPLESDYKLPEIAIACPKEGYEIKRTTLPITADDRPSVSLWAILKNSIGKDLTKISFPVSFNEPISMLQRMAEDMQFSECLDAAAEQPDSLIRMAYVAGFAMSNYSSTVGRLAKPFNPLLGETFEYVEPDKEYRYLSEQISHHPPMSACFVESPRWRYSGEVDAKNKFTGKAFEIKPTGVAHATIYLNKTFEGVEDYPESPVNPNRLEEHYTWKKVTTIVTNFILGSPSIDHYGDMEITNHRTGERCVLTFKPRGWRGKDANEVKGNIYDRNGQLAWELAGKWTTQLIARRAGAATEELAPDQSVPSTQGTKGREYLQLWKNDERDPSIPFNLTRFAVTLNNINEQLKVWLPPTDCRLRPDQHAFERGAWEKANELKSALEDYQRMTKRRREMGELPKHEPRWFKPMIDPDTQERTWDAIRAEDGVSVAYWEERMKVGSSRKEGQATEWNNVDHIFGEFELIEG